MKRQVYYPRVKLPIEIPPPKASNKSNCIIAFYGHGYDSVGSRAYIMEYEELNNS